MVFRHIHRFFHHDDETGEVIRHHISPETHRVAVPVGFQRPPTLAEQVARLVVSREMSNAAAQRGLESFEEADDFDIPDDPIDPTTPYEASFDLAALRGADFGVVQPFNESDGRKAKGRVDAAKRSYFSRKKPAEPEASVDASLSQETAEPPKAV